jgi:hypothetical protein
MARRAGKRGTGYPRQTRPTHSLRAPAFASDPDRSPMYERGPLDAIVPSARSRGRRLLPREADRARTATRPAEGRSDRLDEHHHAGAGDREPGIRVIRKAALKHERRRHVPDRAVCIVATAAGAVASNPTIVVTATICRTGYTDLRLSPDQGDPGPGRCAGVGFAARTAA